MMGKSVWHAKADFPKCVSNCIKHENTGMQWMLSARFHTDTVHHDQAESRLSVLQSCLFTDEARGSHNSTTARLRNRNVCGNRKDWLVANRIEVPSPHPLHTQRLCAEMEIACHWRNGIVVREKKRCRSSRVNDNQSLVCWSSYYRAVCHLTPCIFKASSLRSIY